jgi:hypothetical protein
VRSTSIAAVQAVVQVKVYADVNVKVYVVLKAQRNAMRALDWELARLSSLGGGRRDRWGTG